MKKLFSVLFVLVLSIVLFNACGVTAIMTDYPQASSGFEPKYTYSISQDLLWSKIINVLTLERIGVTKNDKSINLIESEFVNAGFEKIEGGQKELRYSYTFTVEKVSDNSTKLNIIVKLESKSNVRGSILDWHDISKENMKLVSRIEKAMFEKIENILSTNPTNTSN